MPIGIAKLLEAYDDYPHVVAARDKALLAARQAEEQMLDALDQRRDMERRMKELLKEHKASEKALEERVRAELNAKINELELQVDTVLAERDEEVDNLNAEMDRQVDELTVERDGLKKDKERQRAKMVGWVEARERFDKEREKAAVERTALDTRMRELEKEITDDLKVSTK